VWTSTEIIGSLRLTHHVVVVRPSFQIFKALRNTLPMPFPFKIFFRVHSAGRQRIFRPNLTDDLFVPVFACRSPPPPLNFPPQNLLPPPLHPFNVPTFRQIPKTRATDLLQRIEVGFFVRSNARILLACLIVFSPISPLARSEII